MTSVSKNRKATRLKFCIRHSFIAITTHAKSHFNRLMETLIFSIRACEPPSPLPGPGEQLKRPGLIGLTFLIPDIRNVKADDERRSDPFQNKCIFKMLNIKWTHKRSNDELRKTAKQKSVQEILRTRRLSYFGHICRMEESRLPKIMMRFKDTTRETKPKMVKRWTKMDKDGQR